MALGSQVGIIDPKTHTLSCKRLRSSVLVLTYRADYCPEILCRISGLPSFSNSTEHLAKNCLCYQQMSELSDQRLEAMVWHGGDEFVEHAALAEQRVGPFPTALSPAAIWLARAGQRRGRRAVPPELPITMKSQG